MIGNLNRILGDRHRHILGRELDCVVDQIRERPIELVATDIHDEGCFTDHSHIALEASGSPFCHLLRKVDDDDLLRIFR